MDCFIRRFWQVLGVVVASAITAMVVLAVASPKIFDLVTARLIHAMVPWITAGVMLAIVWKVIDSMLPKSAKGGGKKDG